VKTHLYKSLLYLILSFSAFQVHAKKLYTEVPALIHLAKVDQQDTNGFNLVEHLPKLLYDAILQNKVTLWDSPKKQIAISASALQKIESDNFVSFQKIENLFINELWTGSRRKTQFVIIGFSFLSEGKKGKVSFGYIDFNEAIPVLTSKIIPTNVNGSAMLNYAEALYSRKYVFNLMQFGNNTFFNDINKSIQIKRDAFANPKKRIQGLHVLKNDKMMVYALDKNPGEVNDPASLIYESVEQFLNTNKATLLNIGGSKYYSNKVMSDVIVTRIEITEYWQKNKNTITYTPVSIRIFVNNKPLNDITIEDFNKWQLLFSFKSLEDVLIEKQFQYHLYKINSELIPLDVSDLFIKAIKEYKWSQVRNYVKYSKE
jgi:hypothetical protein